MDNLRYITVLLIGLFAVSCTKAPVYQESLVPKIASITSIPETHSATLRSDLNVAPYGKVECGFYFGTDKTTLTRVQSTLTGKSFVSSLNDLRENTTYYFKAFISNGISEIASGFESFITDAEPVVPEIPEDPTPEDPEPDDPEPGDPEPDDPPTDPEPEDPTPEDPAPEDPEPEDPAPEDPAPEDPPAEFTVEIEDLTAHHDNDILELTATLSGDVSLITDCWFLVGTNPEKLSKIKGSLEDGAVKAYLAGLSPGTYHYKAVITNGTDTKESEMNYYVLD